MASPSLTTLGVTALIASYRRTTKVGLGVALRSEFRQFLNSSRVKPLTP